MKNKDATVICIENGLRVQRNKQKPTQATSTTATPCARVAMEIPALLVSNRKVVVQLALQSALSNVRTRAHRPKTCYLQRGNELRTLPESTLKHTAYHSNLHSCVGELPHYARISMAS